VNCVCYCAHLAGDSELGFSEFVIFISVIKQLEERCKTDEGFVEKNFPQKFLRRSMIARKDSMIWKESMETISEEAVKEAWGELLRNLGMPEVAEDDTSDQLMSVMRSRLRKMFMDFDSDKNMKLDMVELGKGLSR
jgi:hypothetical protein